MTRIYTRRPAFDRVMDRIEKHGGHWLWTGSVGSSGYGKVRGTDGRDLLVHRVVWEHLRGPIPDGLVLDHTDRCLRILCCNPDHLEPVTQAENRRRQSERRTTCNAGHRYTTENTFDRGNGRECRTCHADRERLRRIRKRRPDYEQRCDRGHLRTPENTLRQGTGLRCRTCTAEAATARHARAAERESGSAV